MYNWTIEVNGDITFVCISWASQVPNCRLHNGVASTATIVHTRIYINGIWAYRIHISASAEHRYPWYCDICGEDTLFIVLKQWRWKIIFIKNTNVQDVPQVWNRKQQLLQKPVVTACSEITKQKFTPFFWTGKTFGRSYRCEWWP
jgi:hypothetical protein